MSQYRGSFETTDIKLTHVLVIAIVFSYLPQRGRRTLFSSPHAAADSNGQLVIVCTDVLVVYGCKECVGYVQAERLADVACVVSACQSPFNRKFGGWVTPVTVDIKYEVMKQAELISRLEM